MLENLRNLSSIEKCEKLPSMWGKWGKPLQVREVCTQAHASLLDKAHTQRLPSPSIKLHQLLLVRRCPCVGVALGLFVQPPGL